MVQDLLWRWYNMTKVQYMIDLINKYTGIGKRKIAQLPLDEFQALFELVNNKIYADESLKHGIKNALKLI